MISSAFKKLFGGRGEKKVEVVASQVRDLADEEIPRYPPFAKGLPMAPVDKVLQTQNELIQKIRSTLGFTQEEYDRLVMPVIGRYAAFVHLLPASEAHHHRGAGGLFRHGLEVAFWATQASESVIFSISGSPRERRNNEPRWRLACCFSGLLHDVGKPLSDVVITNSDGSKTWNPYSETLVDWAKRHNVSRYFLRWRDREHKRHEQFSLLTVERILTPEALEFLADPGKDIVESMLQAISGLRINDPVTKLMLKADGESVSRDLKQNRLDVDEFAYGVPVERYVFDALRRLVKTGKWKVNEPGAKVWHLHQGVFITWKQGASDIYDLLTEDKIPGIPRDPDTLADILIERGFALKNVLPEHGKDVFYRYWEVIPELPQEGEEVTGKIKMQMLRLESSELVFTTEPPAAIAGEVIGDEDEQELDASELDDDAPEDGDENSDSLTATPEPIGSLDDGFEIPDFMAAPPSTDSQSSEPKGGTSTDTKTSKNDDKADAPKEPSAQEIAQTAAPLALDDPLKGLKDAGGALGVCDFPFDAFGLNTEPDTTQKDKAETPNVPTEQSEEDTSLPGIDNIRSGKKRQPKASANTAASLSPNEFFGPEPSAIFDAPPMPPEDMFAPIDAVPLDAYDYSHEMEEREEFVPTEHFQDAETYSSSQQDKSSDVDVRGHLENVLSGYGAAESILKEAIIPVLDGQKTLGEVLCFMKKKAVILYPEGARALGAPAEVLNTLFDAGAIVPDPVHPNRKVHDFSGIKGLLLSSDISDVIKAAIEQAEKDFDPIREVSALNDKRQSGKKAEKAHSEKKVKSQQTNQSTPKKPKPAMDISALLPGEQTGGRSSENKRIAQQTAQGKKGTAAKTQTEQHKNESENSASNEEKQNVSRLPKRQKPKTTVNKPPKETRPVSLDFDSDLELPMTKVVGQIDLEDEEPKKPQKAKEISDEDFLPPQSDIDAEEAIRLLKEMIKNQKGRWLVGPVIKEDGCLVTSDKALEKVTGECTNLSKSMLRALLASGQRRPRMTIRQGNLRLEVE